MEFSGKKVTVVGTGISGIGAVGLLNAVGAEVVLYDGNEKLKIEDIEKKKILLPNYNFIVHEMFSQHSINGEIIKKGMDKGLAIKKVVETLHMKMEDTIAFGDSMNDYEMLQVCNYGVAMKNACQELKASADNICESVENDGVYYEMERLGLFECLD